MADVLPAQDTAPVSTSLLVLDSSVPSDPAPAPATDPAPPTIPTLRERVVDAARSWVGTRYVWGGDSPEDGFDCSGLVRFVFQQTIGMDLPRVARQQRKEGKAVAKDELKPGDLVFFNTRRRDPGSHVGIYIGNDQFLHAPSRGSQVRVDQLHSSYWAQRFTGARRLITSKTLGLLPASVQARFALQAQQLPTAQ